MVPIQHIQMEKPICNSGLLSTFTTKQQKVMAPQGARGHCPAIHHLRSLLTADFKIMEELTSMKSMKGIAKGRDFFTEKNACLTCSLTQFWQRTLGQSHCLSLSLKEETFLHIRRHAQTVLVLFGST